MKKFVCFLSAFLLMTSLFAKTETLPAVTNDNGDIEVNNSKGKVEDRIHIENNTDSNLTIFVKGVHKRKGLLDVASGFVSAHDTKFITTDFEDSLDDFKSFIISLENGKIISFTAEMAWSDLYFAINKIEGGTIESANKSDADELLKWKKLLDSGVITQDEFNAKKKQILGL